MTTSSHWLLLRGLTRESVHWGDFVATFRQTLPGAVVHQLDLPGNGQRHQERSPATVDALVRDLRTQLQRQHIPLPVHVLALSLGAMVTVHWAQVAPHEVASAVLVNTSLRPFSPLHHRMQVRNWPRLLHLALRKLPPEAAERLIWQMTSRQPVDESVLARWVQARQRHPVSGGNAIRQLLAAARYRAPSQSPPVPLLLLSSAHDQLVSPSCSQAVAQAWGTPLMLNQRAGHDLPLDDPMWVAQRVHAWHALQH